LGRGGCGLRRDESSLLSYTLRYVSLVAVTQCASLGIWVARTDRKGNFLVHYYELRNQEIIVHYESIKRELKIRLIYEYRCDERLKTKREESTRLTDTGLVVELKHLKTKTRLIDEKFVSVRGECETSIR
jgi:hypothetical protein